MSNQRGGRPGIPALGVPLGRTVTAGAGLTGGGALSGNITIDVGAGNGITVNANDVALASSSAGAGLTYTNGVLAVGAGTGITVNADDVALAATVAGVGLTHAAGVLAVGAGTGITVNADDVAVNLANAFAWTEAHTFTKTAIGTAQTEAITAQNTTAAADGLQQYGPVIASIGQGWSTGGGGNTLAGGAIQARPVQGATATVELDFLTRIGAGAWTSRGSLSSSGVLRLPANGQFTFAGGGLTGLLNPGTDQWQLVSAGAALVRSNSGTTLGFFGTTPAAQPAGIANADGTLADITTKFNTLITALETLGLIAAV